MVAGLTHLRHCFVSLSKTPFPVLVHPCPGKTHPDMTEKKLNGVLGTGNPETGTLGKQ